MYATKNQGLADLLESGHDLRTLVDVPSPVLGLTGLIAVKCRLASETLEAGSVRAAVGAPQALGSRIRPINDLAQVRGRTVVGVVV